MRGSKPFWLRMSCRRHRSTGKAAKRSPAGWSRSSGRVKKPPLGLIVGPIL